MNYLLKKLILSPRGQAGGVTSNFPGPQHIQETQQKNRVVEGGWLLKLH